MSNDNIYIEIKNEFLVVHKDYLRRYKSRWCGLPRSDQVEHIRYWVEEIVSGNVNPRNIASAHQASKRLFKSYPPLIGEFIGLCSKCEIETGGSAIEKSVYKFHNAMLMQYGVLWCNTKNVNEQDFVSSLISSVTEITEDAAIVGDALEYLKSKSILSYPPSKSAVQIECLKKFLGIEVPEPEKAYLYASGAISDDDLSARVRRVINTVKNTCGAYEIRTKNSEALKKRFIEMYSSSMIKELKNTAEVSGSEVDKTENEEFVDLCFTRKTIDELLSKI